MKFVALNTSIVVLAEAHNPTILHPSFLQKQGIVPLEWQVEQPVMCTPGFSMVKYANRVVFTAELNKFMVQDNAPKEDTPLADLALRYVDALPHVHYSAVGINISGYVECSSAETWMMERFLRQGPGNDEKVKPNAMGLRLVYPVENGVLNLSCDAGVVQKSGEGLASPSLLISGNYHSPFAGDPSVAEARKAIGSFKSRVNHFAEISELVFGLER